MITASDELLVRHALLDMVLTAMGSGRVIPAPIYFNDRADYWASFDETDYETQDNIETNGVVCCWLYLKRFIDDPLQPPDSPEVTLLYEFYLFTQYDLKRADESLISPDAFQKLMLKKHNDFVEDLLAIKAAFQGIRNLGVLNTDKYVIQQTNSISMVGDNLNRGLCDFIPSVRGHIARFEERVYLKLKEC